MIAIKLNSQIVKASNNISLNLFLTDNKLESSTGIAVALNQTVIQKENWKEIYLKDGDEILIITATQGG